MTTDKIDTQQLFSMLDETSSAFSDLISSVDEKLLNVVPFKDSWTVAQIATHVKKSNNAIIQALQMQGTLSERNAEKRVDELKKIFLDFEAKYKSPDFIVPENKEYKKDAVVEQLKNSIEKIKQLRQTINLYEIINLPGFDELTKLEILHFVLYHTQRHLHQLKNVIHICNGVN